MEPISVLFLYKATLILCAAFLKSAGFTDLDKNHKKLVEFKLRIRINSVNF